MASYLDGNGLLYFWQKIKNTFVPSTRKVNNKALSTDISLTASDVGALPSSTAIPSPGTGSNYPVMDGTRALGSQAGYAKVDHVHPSDTTKVDKVSGKGLSANDFTDTLKNKLDGIASGAEVNQNAFSNVKVGSTTVASDSKTDTLELVAGSNVTLTPDATNDKVTIAATDTTYSEATGSAAGLMSAADKTKLAGIASGAEVNQNAFSNVKVGSTTVAADGKTDTLELVAGSNVTLTPDATNDKVTIAATNTTYSDATTSAHGLMSAADKTKLNGIDAGATKVWYGSSATLADVVDKVVDCEGFTLTDGVLVLVSFYQSNSASSITMNVNGTGALPVYVHGYYTNTPRFDSQNVYLFRYAEVTGNSHWKMVEGGASLKTGVNATLSSVTPTSTASRQYAVVLDKDGYLSVNVPWAQRTLSSTNPSMDGTAAAGSSSTVARADHVHPSDTSRVPTSRTVNGKALSSNITLSASDVSAIPTSAKGAASGVCPLNSSSKIDAAYLPSYVDDVIEAYPRSGQTALSSTWLATGSASGTVITPETGKIYVLMAASGTYAANSQFRWGGSAYVLLQSGEGISAITNAEIDTIVAS